ncbi:MAG: porin family protein [Sphaerochaeta sp.]|nr:porin family protein [Sphaerochaeta sp.]
MKKHVMLALLILFLGSSFVFAGAFGAGVSAGGSLSFVGTEAESEGSPRYGFTGGVYADYAFYSIENVVDFSVQPGVYFAMKGFNTDHPAFEETKVNLNYIEVPVLLKAGFPLGLPVDPYILVGPTVGVRLSSDYEAEAAEGELNENIKLIDYGVTMGAGVDLDMGLSIDARFNLGLVEIGDEAAAAFGGVVDWKNRSVSLMVSYNIL